MTFRRQLYAFSGFLPGDAGSFFCFYDRDNAFVVQGLLQGQFTTRVFECGHAICRVDKHIRLQTSAPYDVVAEAMAQVVFLNQALAAIPATVSY